MKPKFYDPMCVELAQHFLQDDEGTLLERAQRVQSLAWRFAQAVEDWYEDEDDREDGREGVG